jgi:Biotin-lipoyl like
MPGGWRSDSADRTALICYVHSVEIIPGVSGSVIDVPIEPNRPIKAGEVLFKIDPVAYQARHRLSPRPTVASSPAPSTDGW